MARAVKIEARNRIFLGFRSTVSLVRFDLSPLSLSFSPHLCRGDSLPVG